MKDKACDFCHRLPLHAGGCNLFCIKGGCIGRLMLSIEMVRLAREIFEKDLSLGIETKSI